MPLSFHPINRSPSKPGLVSLVGAGPGDPEYLTLKAARRLAEADLLLYDALVRPEVLQLASHARRFFVGKRAGRPGTAQSTIHALMIRWAKRGLRVVRLKSGDPFVFGRGGEEMLALSAAHVPFEVVPGVSAALAAPALAGIPVTHRGLSSAFLVLTGHCSASFARVLDEMQPQSLTLVVLMGLASRRELVAMLRQRGWQPDTPAAILGAASTPEAFTWTGRLEQLGDASLPRSSTPAYATIVIGDVVGLSRGISLGSAAGPYDVEPLPQTGAMAQ